MEQENEPEIWVSGRDRINILRELDKACTMEVEMQAAVIEMKSGKTPGLDRCAVEWWQVWSVS